MAIDPLLKNFQERKNTLPVQAAVYSQVSSCSLLGTEATVKVLNSQHPPIVNASACPLTLQAGIEVDFALCLHDQNFSGVVADLKCYRDQVRPSDR